ncbi:hypothetical protein TNCV_1779971 [Trichonephila clavipes]|nr:hypothetical protein TNCV_1779971 [Trichonephila clavipes]
MTRNVQKYFKNSEKKIESHEKQFAIVRLFYEENPEMFLVPGKSSICRKIRKIEVRDLEEVFVQGPYYMVDALKLPQPAPKDSDLESNTRAIDDGPSNSKMWSSDEDDTKVVTLLSKLLDGDRFNSCQVIYSQFGLAIHQNDHQARRRFVEWAQNEIAVVPDFHKRILFSDEAHYWLNGYVNKQNCRIWSEANPQVYVETPLHPEKLTVWCALWAGGILLQKR